MAKVVAQYRQAKNIELNLNTSVSARDEAPYSFKNVQWMATDSHDIYLFATEHNGEKITNELLFAKNNNKQRGHYYHKSYDMQKEDSAFMSVAYILASGGVSFEMFRNLYYDGQAPFSIQKLNTIKDYTCWIRQADTSIYNKSFFVVSMSDTVFLSALMNESIKKKYQKILDSIKPKSLPPFNKDKNFPTRYYKLIIDKTNLSIYSVFYKSKADDILDFLENTLVQCTLDQPWSEFNEKLTLKIGK